ncbi:MAG TPA: tRNA (adenosine(37)-N6)-threonylcarbamoyltransferase complex dimerization subunit type 1 TsaB [Terriglobales bacterium]|nr:tRNA (adenosine(37)-N6)-threonylcarbamoyltransferase complex dimerization subunit type 1 TsaB [Terriglobales bacterium]
MLLLAADTSGKHGSIALARAESDSFEVIEVVPLIGGTFSAQLVPQIAALLSRHGFSKQDVGGFAVASGPGSFTGLRVGLAAIKALAEVLGRPIAAVSLLEAVAVASGARGKVMAVLDAGRGELYVGEYDVTGELAKCLQERILVRDQLEQTLDGSATVTPDANVAELARGAGLKVHEIERPRSDAIARVGWKKILAGDTVSPEALEANYIRRSDAEIFAGPGP